MKTITHEMLVIHCACIDQRELFLATFGQSMDLTEANWQLAISAGLDVTWAHMLLSTDAKQAYYAQERPWREAHEAQVRPLLLLALQGSK